MPAPRRPLPGLTIRLDGHPARSETRYARLSAWSLHITSCLPDNGVELHSTYTGAAGAATQAQHLALAPQIACSSATTHDEDQLPVWSSRRRCLLDHLSLLQEHLAELGYHPEIDTLDSTLEATER